jgi:serine/threonine-protein kinase
VAWALGYAHGQGVVHRDVKPDNILLENGSGRALVTDFGIAALVREASGLDGGAVTGTPEFMSPEQALGQAVDGRSDLYALGAVGYFAVSGRLLFDGATATAVLAKQIAERPRPLTEVADAVPRRLGQVIEQCLAKDAGERPASADAVAERLGVALEQRRELPVALRWFAKTGARLSGVGSFAYLIFGLPTLVGLGAAVGEGSGALLGFVAGVTVVPLMTLVGRAHRFLRSGFDRADLGAAFRRDLEDGREEREYEFGRRASLYERVMRLLGAGGLSVGIVAMIIRATTPWFILREVYGDSLGIAMFFGFTGGATASVLWLYRLNRRIDLDTRIWSWLWTGRAGRLLFALARPFVRRRELPAGATYRATELALSLAAEKLFDELPKATRRQLADLPDTVRRLEQDAQRMRARLEQLNDAIGDPGSGTREPGSVDEDELTGKRDRVLRDLVAEREAVQGRLAQAVAALETIRLNLLKLHAGSTTVATLTTDLGQAQEVAREIDLLLRGQREVDDLLGPTNEARPA